MFCAQRMQWIIQAIILGIVMGMAASGMSGDKGMLQLAFLVQLGMMVMLLIAGLTGWCPGLIALKKVFPSCDETTHRSQN